MSRSTLAALLLLLPATALPAQDTAAWKNERLPLETRVRDLVGRMTLEEKVSQLRYDAPAIDRLGIPAYNWWSEALHGVARAGLATVYPQVIGLAATWNDSLLYRIGSSIGEEARAKHHAFARTGRRDIYQGLTIFTPNINIFRDPRWGRGQETFGEDPVLTSSLAVPFVRGMQGDDPRYLQVGTTAKHYAVHSGPEPIRHTFNAQPSEQDLQDTYLPAFEALVRQGDVASVMCAYNRFRDAPACASDELLQRTLRERWGFSGYVVSDCWAIMDFVDQQHLVATVEEAAAMALHAGTDLNCGVAFQSLVKAVQQGRTTEAEVGRALARVLGTRFRLGTFDDPAHVPYAATPYAVVNNDAHRQLAQQAARESIVLLTNNGILPLSRRDLRSVAVIGPNARNAQALLGNYHGTARMLPDPLSALRNALPPRIQVLYAQGSELTRGAPVLVPIPSTALRTSAGSAGLDAAYFFGQHWSGAPRLERTDSIIDFTWLDDTPVTGQLADSFSVRWTGRLAAPASGRYRLAFQGMNGMKLWLDDSLRIDFQNRHAPVTRTFDVDLVAGHAYTLRIDYFSFGPDPQARLLWAPPRPDLLQEAVATARAADVTLLYLGITPDLESEEDAIDAEGFGGGDRITIELPRVQEELLRAVEATGKPVIVVLLSGSALAVPWAAEHADAMVQAWYPGEAGARAIADVIFGDYNPAGRLPITLYRATSDLPAFDDYRMEGHTYRFFRGEPLFPFGHGLSYTSFAYDSLTTPAQIREGDPLTVSVRVRNTGTRTGDEVVQLYLAHPAAPFQVPIRALAAFRRVTLQPGESKRIEFDVPAERVTVVDPSGRRVWLKGPLELAVGGKQPALGGLADARTTGVLVRTFELR